MPPRASLPKGSIPKEILNGYCRFCLLSNQKLYSIKEVFLIENRPCGQTVKINLMSAIRLFREIKIKCNDSKPQSICMDCIDCIKDFYDFFQYFKENDCILNQILSTNLRSTEQCKDLIGNFLQKRKKPKSSISFSTISGENHKHRISDQCDNKLAESLEIIYNIKDEEGKKLVPTDLTNAPDLNSFEESSKLIKISEDDHSQDYFFDDHHSRTSTDDEVYLSDLKKDLERYNNKSNETQQISDKIHSYRYQGKKVKTKFKNGEQFICQFCQEKFTDIHSTIAHFEEYHANEGQCLICLKNIHLYMKFHISNHAEVSTSCRSCRIYFGNQDLLEDHYQKFDHTSTRCHLCNKKFLTKSKRNFHLKVVHYNTVKPFCCEICGKQFRYMPNMERHKRTHIIPKRFMCSQCGEKYSTNNALRRHILKIHEGKVIDKQTGEKVPYVPKPTGRRRRTGGTGKYLTIKCEYCDTILTSKNGYARHLETHPEFRDYSCRFCDDQYPTRALLREHLDDAHNRHLCQVCGKKFLHGYLLERHYGTYHKELGVAVPALKDIALYECEVCKNKFRSRPALADHMRVHTGEKPFKCKVCDKGFKQKAHLTIHQIQHTGERPNKCHICGKCFTFKWTLESHIRIHTGEKPFSCPYCSNCYRDSTLLLKHKKKDHPDKVITTKRGKIAKPRNNFPSTEDGLDSIIENCVSNSINKQE